MHFLHSNALYLTTYYYLLPTASILLLLEDSYLLLKDVNIAILTIAFCKGYRIAHAQSKNDKYSKTYKVRIAYNN